MVIYKVSLKGNYEDSRLVYDNMKLMAYLVYDALMDYEYESDKDILFKDGVTMNELYDGFRNRINKYEFEHGNFTNGEYEPFMIDDTSFGFTVNDGSINKEKIAFFVNEIKKLIRVDYEFNIEEFKLLNGLDRVSMINSFYGKNNVHVKTRTKKIASLTL